MKILYINSFFDPNNIGGAENYLKDLVKYFSKNNKIVIITTKDIKENQKSIFDKNKNIKIYRFFPWNISYYLRLKKIPRLLQYIYYLIDIWNIQVYFYIKKIIKKENPDIIHTHNIYGLSTSVFSAIKSLKKTHLHNLHDLNLIDPGGILFYNNKPLNDLPLFLKTVLLIKKIFYRKIKNVIAPSYFIFKIHKKFGLFKKSSFYLSRLGINEYNIINKKISNKNINILFIGRLSVEKGILRLINIFKNETDFIVHIAGTGPLQNKIIKKTNKYKHIKYYGYVKKKKKFNLFKNTDFIIIPSICMENSPKIIYEAHSFGVPVIANDVGGISEIIDNQYDILININNKKSVNNMFNIIKKRKKMNSKLINKNINKKLLASNVYSKVNSIYLDLINENKKL